MTIAGILSALACAAVVVVGAVLLFGYVARALIIAGRVLRLSIRVAGHLFGGSRAR